MAGVAGLGLGGMPPRPLNAPAGQQAAGGVQPGQSNAIVTANRVIITGASGELLVYAGTPAFGNLIASISAVAGTDNDGNAFLAGTVSYHTIAGFGRVAIQQLDALNWYQAATAAGPWGAPIANISAGPSLQIQAPGSATLRTAGDGNPYNMASLTIPMNPVNQLVNSVAAATVNNLTANVTAGTTYRLRGQVQYAGAGAAGTANFQFGTTATFSTQWGDADFHDGVAGTSGYVARPAGLGPFASPTLSVNNWFAKFDALATCTAAGQVSLQAFCSVAADTFTIKNAFMEVIPLA